MQTPGARGLAAVIAEAEMHSLFGFHSIKDAVDGCLCDGCSFGAAEHMGFSDLGAGGGQIGDWDRVVWDDRLTPKADGDEHWVRPNVLKWGDRLSQG